MACFARPAARAQGGVLAALLLFASLYPSGDGLWEPSFHATDHDIGLWHPAGNARVALDGVGRQAGALGHFIHSKSPDDDHRHDGMNTEVYIPVGVPAGVALSSWCFL